MKRSIITMAALFLVSGMVSGAEYMTAEEVKELVSGKTFDGLNVRKDVRFHAYADPDGTHTVKLSNGKTQKRTWSVNDEGQHCVAKKSKDPYCTHVKDMGNGQYHKINNDGKHTHTLTNFREGNDL